MQNDCRLWPIIHSCVIFEVASRSSFADYQPFRNPDNAVDGEVDHGAAYLNKGRRYFIYGRNRISSAHSIVLAQIVRLFGECSGIADNVKSRDWLSQFSEFKNSHKETLKEFWPRFNRTVAELENLGNGGRLGNYISQGASCYGFTIIETSYGSGIIGRPRVVEFGHRSSRHYRKKCTKIARDQ